MGEGRLVLVSYALALLCDHDVLRTGWFRVNI